MKAADVMVHNVITTYPKASVGEVAKLLVEKDISALPVLDASGRVVGVISEADLMRREEIGSQKMRPWWLEAVTPGAVLAEDFTRSHAKKVDELMSTEVISATENASLGEIATLLETHRIKRVMILREGRLVGVVSRANLIQALASMKTSNEGHPSDHMLRAEIISRLGEQHWTDFGDRNVTVVYGVAHIWGLVGSPSERKALIALAEGVPGVLGVRDEMIGSYL